MTKQEAIKELKEYAEASWGSLNETFKIAIECIQKCMDEEESPCSSCQEFDCHGCLYSGRLD